MDLYKLRAFITVVDHGSITKAASVLNMTQPPLSILIRKLETELNVTLFSRQDRRLTLTHSGEVLYQKARKLIAFADDIKDELTESEKGLRGTIKVGCATSPSYLFLPDVVEKLRNTAPNIVVRTSEGPSAYIFQELKNHNVDVGIVPVIYEAEDYEITPLYRDPVLIVVPDKHPLSQRKSVNITDLKDENFLLTNTSIGQSISDQIIAACQSNGFSPNTVYWGTDTMPMVKMVLKGLGIAFMPSSYERLHLFSDYFKSQRLHLVELKSPKIDVKYSLVTYKNKYNGAIVDQFIKAAKDAAQSFLRNEESLN